MVNIHNNEMKQMIDISVSYTLTFLRQYLNEIAVTV